MELKINGYTFSANGSRHPALNLNDFRNVREFSVQTSLMVFPSENAILIGKREQQQQKKSIIFL